jgi:hypothetical protein
VVKRRSLDDALTPEQQAFLDSGTAKPAHKSKPVKKKEKPPMDRSTAVLERPQSPSAPQASAGTFALNTRIEAYLSDAMIKATMDRKMQRHESPTQRDITEEALTEWFKKHGYLK